MKEIARRYLRVLAIRTVALLISGFILAALSTGSQAQSSFVGVDAVSSGTTAGSSLSIPHTTSGTDRLMLVGVSINNRKYETVSSITYNGISLTYVDSETQSDDARVEIWKLVDPPVGTYDVELIFSADLRRYAVAGVTTFNGVDPTDPLGTFAGNNATTNSANLTVTAVSSSVLALSSTATGGSLLTVTVISAVAVSHNGPVSQIS